MASAAGHSGADGRKTGSPSTAGGHTCRPADRQYSHVQQRGSAASTAQSWTIAACSSSSV